MMRSAIGIEFSAPRRAAVVPRQVPEPREGEALVRGRVSVVSAGTELLAYRGELPREVSLDDTIESLAGEAGYPLRYGYCVLGQVEAGPPELRGRRVFAFAPHESLFVCPLGALVPVPDDIGDDDAVFLAHAETLVNLLHDGSPLAGEWIAILGQGLVGLFLTATLSKMLPTRIAAVDPLGERRSLAVREGAASVHHPEELTPGLLRDLLGDDRRYPGFDLVYELSGNPSAADQAVAVCGYSGRIVLGSWYGTKRVSLDLGGRFHRSRISIKSSQVSTIDPRLTGEFDKPRRFAVAWEMIRRIRPARFVSHRLPLSRGGEAYSLLEEAPEKTLTVLLDHQGD
ncbi:MAG: zinc-dependent alcohol dehydrogenase [Spirochaetaceae bacterium]